MALKVHSNLFFRLFASLQKTATMFLIAVLIAAVAAASQPDALTTITRNGRQAEIRFFSQLSAVSNVLIQNQPYGGTVLARVVVGSTVLDGPTTIAPGSEDRTYKRVDTGSTGAASVVLEVQGTGVSPNPVVTISCPGITNGDRATYVITQTVSPPQLLTGGCTVTSGVLTGSDTCRTNTVVSQGSVNVLCNILIVDKLSEARSCNDVPVRFYTKTGTCPVTVQLSLTGKKTATEETILSVAVPTTFGTSTPLKLNRKTAVQIKTVPLFAAGTSARFIDAFVSATGDLTVDTPLETAFLNVANLAYRSTTPVGSLIPQKDNTFTIVITRDSATLTTASVVHFQQGLQSSSTLGWIEVPAGSTYTLHVFDDSVTSFDLVFGNNVAMPAIVAQSAILSGSSPALAANEMRIFRIDTNAVTTVPLSSGSSLNVLDSTKFIIWNHIGVPAKFASLSEDCCNFLDNNGVFTGNSPAGDGSVILPIARDETKLTNFQVFGGSADCKSLGSPLISTAVNLVDQTSDDQCARQGLFLAGRPVSITSASCTSSSVVGVVPMQTCTGPVTSTSTKLVSNDGQPDDINSVPVVVSIAPVRFCDCQPAPTGCPAIVDLECDEQKQVDLIAAAIASSGSSINVNTNNRATTLLNAVKGIANDIDDVADDIDDVADELEDVADDIEDVADDVGDLL
jgi:hypothetical protein